MSGKFMRVKRFIIPTLTAVIIASQLMGCAAMTQSELLQAINNGDQIGNRFVMDRVSVPYYQCRSS